ncbi:MAG: ADP-ribosylglycohydrolase family protein [Candidatus Ranarchaeia archaeon]
MDIKDRIRGAFVGLYFGSGVNPRLSPRTRPKAKYAMNLPPEEARERFGNKRFDEIERDYKLYDQHTQTKIIYDMLMKDGEISPEIFKDHLLELHRRVNVFKGKVYGPSTRRAVRSILANVDIYQMGRKGTTCGSAMRALPIGMYFYNDMDALIKNTVDSCIVSHNTDVAIDAAIVTNATLASLLNGKSKFEAIKEGIKITKKYHGKFGEPTSGPKIHEIIQYVLDLTKGMSMEKAMFIIPEKIGVSWFARETIPAAFANYIVTDNPKDSTLLALRCGGDSQTIPEIACAFFGATKGPKLFPKSMIRKIEEVNNVKIYEMAEKLVDKMGI